jgi:hypothetical protein
MNNDEDMTPSDTTINYKVCSPCFVYVLNSIWEVKEAGLICEHLTNFFAELSYEIPLHPSMAASFSPPFATVHLLHVVYYESMSEHNLSV